MFELRLSEGRVFVWGFHPGLVGHLSLIKAPPFFQGLDWQLHRQSEPSGFWRVQPLDAGSFTALTDQATFCRKLDLSDTDVGVGFLHIESFRTNLDLFLSPTALSENGRSIYDQWSGAITDAIKGLEAEAVVRLNIGPCTDEEIAGYRDSLWLGTKDIDLEIRPRIFAPD